MDSMRIKSLTPPPPRQPGAFPIASTLEEKLRACEAYRNGMAKAAVLQECFSCTQRYTADEMHNALLSAKLKENMKALLKGREDDADVQALKAQWPSSKLGEPLLAHDAGLPPRTGKKRRVYLCGSCVWYIRKGRVPRFSLANRLWNGPALPAKFLNMSSGERMLSSGGRLQGMMHRLTELAGPGTGQMMLKGHIAVFPHDISATLTKLPKAADSLVDELTVVFVGAKLPERNNVELLKHYKVRPQLVREFIEWLRQHNPVFKQHIELDEKEMQDIEKRCRQQDGLVPDFFWRCFRHVPREAMPDETRTPNPDALPHQPHGTTVSGVVDVEAAGVSEEEIARGPLIVPRGPNFMQQFGNQSFWTLVFPHHFPYGFGGPFDNRTTYLSLRDYGQWVMRRSAREMRCDPAFYMLIFNLIQRTESTAQSRVLVQSPAFMSLAHQLEALNSNNVRHVGIVLRMTDGRLLCVPLCHRWPSC